MVTITITLTYLPICYHRYNSRVKEGEKLKERMKHEAAQEHRRAIAAQVKEKVRRFIGLSFCVCSRAFNIE